MASAKWTDRQFGQALKKQREHRGWTQPQMAKMLVDKGIQPMHDTTIAKIEAGNRSVRINEAVGIADLFEVSVDVLLGRTSSRDDETLGWYCVRELRDTAQFQATSIRRMGIELSDALDGVAFAGHQFYAVTDELSEAAGRVHGSLDDLAGHLGELVQRASRIIEQREQTGE